MSFTSQHDLGMRSSRATFACPEQTWRSTLLKTLRLVR